MKLKLKNMVLSFFLLILLIFISLKITKILLYHKYNIKEFGNIEDEKNKGFVIAFHGIYGEHKDLEEITGFLEKNGYAGVNIQYPTTEGTIEEITEKYISEKIQYYSQYVKSENEKRKIRKLPEMKIHFVVHSLGSVVLRYYLKNRISESLGKVVFISPPSHGSQLSDFPLTHLMKGTLGEAALQFGTASDSFVNKLGDADFNCYILIGNKSNNFLYSWIIPGIDDGMVPFSTAKLDKCKYKTVDNTDHTSILRDKRTFKEIINFLEGS